MAAEGASARTRGQPDQRRLGGRYRQSLRFLPSSQVEIGLYIISTVYLGQEFEVKILKLNRRRRNAVVSRRCLLEQETMARKSEALAHLRKATR